MERAAPWLEGWTGRTADAVRQSAGWRRAVTAFLAGSVSVLAFAPVFASPVLFLTLPVLVWLVDSSRSAKHAAIAAWWFGFGYFFFNLFWVGEAFLVEADKYAVLLPFAITLLPAALAMYWAVAVFFARQFWPQGIARVLVLAVALSVAEWLRGQLFTGFPWNVPGYALTFPLALMQSAALVGVYGLTPLALAIFTGPAVLLSDRDMADRKPIALALAWVAVPLALFAAFGAYRLSFAIETVPGVTIRIVQPSIPQREKWLPEFQRRNFERHVALTLTNAAGEKDDLAGITHVIWPEAAMPFLPLEEPKIIEALGTLLPGGKTLIAGALRREREEGGSTTAVFNSLIAFRDDGMPAAVGDKQHLVPFGEYLPVKHVLSTIGLDKFTFGRGDFAAGPRPRPVLLIPGLPPSVALICYEALFPGEAVQGEERPMLLINLTNDGWFGDTSGPRQHFHQARVRAVEEGLPMIRAANNGISASIGPDGRELGLLAMNAIGTIDTALPRAFPGTPYSKFRELPLWSILLIFLAIARTLHLRG